MNPAEFANIARAERDFWWYRGMRAILFRMMDPHVAGRTLSRVLEAGCGTGYLSHILQNGRGWPVVPMDISAEGLRFARRMNVDRALQGDITRLPFADGTFDLVLSMDVLAHVPKPLEVDAVHEMARTLCRGGLLVIRTSALDLLRSRHSDFVHESQRFTKRRLVDLAATSGIRVIRCTYANALLLPLALVKFRIWEFLRRAPAGSGLEPGPGWLDGTLGAALSAEAAWIGSGRGFPLGQSLLLIGEKQ